MTHLHPSCRRILNLGLCLLVLASPAALANTLRPVEQGQKGQGTVSSPGVTAPAPTVIQPVQPQVVETLPPVQGATPLPLLETPVLLEPEKDMPKDEPPAPVVEEKPETPVVVEPQQVVVPVPEQPAPVEDAGKKEELPVQPVPVETQPVPVETQPVIVQPGQSEVQVPVKEVPAPAITPLDIEKLLGTVGQGKDGPREEKPVPEQPKKPEKKPEPAKKVEKPTKEQKPEKPAKQAKAKPGEAMSLPEDDSLDFLEGIWRCDAGMRAVHQSNEPIVVEFYFDKNGKGHSWIRAQDGLVYRTTVNATIKDRQMTVRTGEYTNPNSNGKFYATTYTCQQAGNRARCNGMTSIGLRRNKEDGAPFIKVR